MKLHSLLLLSILLISSAIMLHHARVDSLTYDENLHLQSAMEWQTMGTSPSDPFNPPLAKLPLSLALTVFPEAVENPFILIPRLTTILLSLAFLATVYAWTRSQCSPLTALIATFLLAFSPTFLAHGHLATTDLLASFLYFLSVTRFLAWHQDPTTEHRLLFWVALTFMAGTKITLLPMFLLFLILFLIGKRVALKSLTPLLHLPTLLLSAIVLWGIYGFHFRSILGLTPPLPLGEFANTLLHALSNSLNPKFAATRQLIYFGNVQGFGWFSYPLVSFLLKSSPAFLILLAFSFTQRSVLFNGKKRTDLPLLLAALSVFAIITLGRYSTGIRHLLPMYPFLAIFIATKLDKLNTIHPLSLSPRTKTREQIRLNKQSSSTRVFGAWASYATISLLAFHLLTAVLLKDPIAYFNPLIPDQNKHTIMTDSNLDWGQSTARLSKEVDPTSLDHLVSMNTHPEEYGFTNISPAPKANELTPEYVESHSFAISATRYYTEGYHTSLLKDAKPLIAANGTYLIFSPTK